MASYHCRQANVVHSDNTRHVPLVIAPCRSLCDWDAVPSPYDGQRLFACRGCGSQWDRSQVWTPMQADGTVPEQVRVERSGGPGNGGS